MSKPKETTASGFLAGSTGSEMPHGLWDARDECWLGNEDGPLVYGKKILAQMAASISTERLGRWVLPKPFDGYGVKKDEITPRLSAVEAIKRIESRIPNVGVSDVPTNPKGVASE